MSKARLVIEGSGAATSCSKNSGPDHPTPRGRSNGVIHAATGEFLRDRVLDRHKNYPPTPHMTNARTHDPWVRASRMS
jgi:hypothetical protein